jgi:AraC-like DNA-binding protein
VAGFAPKYFSKLFHEQQRTTFEKYLFEVRLERARLLLGGTDLQIGRIAELSGFRSPQNLCRVFRRAVGATPLAYRREQLPVSMRKARKSVPCDSPEVGSDGYVRYEPRR